MFYDWQVLSPISGWGMANALTAVRLCLSGQEGLGIRFQPDHRLDRFQVSEVGSSR